MQRLPEGAVIQGFHPFQGRPLFGQVGAKKVDQLDRKMFPSLSGKTSIRTNHPRNTPQTRLHGVSIPFREDLYSDVFSKFILGGDGDPAFPSLSGKTSIRTPRRQQKQGSQ